jgi:hypothetical protein
VGRQPLEQSYDHAVSYDIYFLQRRADLSWEELMEELEESAEASPDLPAALIDAWGRITPQVATVLGEVELSQEARTLELSHDDTGIELTIIGNEVSLTVPYWHTGDRATQVFSQIAAVVSIVERETGLIAFDPQTERPLAEGTAEAVWIMSSNAMDLRSRYSN